MSDDVDLALYALPRIYHACKRRNTGDAATGEVASEHQARILSHLDAFDPTMVTELAEYMGVTPSTMSLNLTRLQEAGLVSRERDPDDGRVMNVRLTEAGQKVRDGRSVLDADRVEAMLRRLRPEDRRQAVRGLSALAAAAGEWPTR